MAALVYRKLAAPLVTLWEPGKADGSYEDEKKLRAGRSYASEKKLEDRKERGSVWLWKMWSLVGERSKGQTWKARKHGFEDVKGVCGEDRGKETGGQRARQGQC